MSGIWIFIGGLIVGLVAGFFIARQTMKSYLQKNPPINEQQLKQMAAGMGRNLSQKQLNQMMQQMKSSAGKK